MFQVHFFDETPYVPDENYPLILDGIASSGNGTDVLRNGGEGRKSRGIPQPFHKARHSGFIDLADRPLCPIPDGSKLLLHSLKGIDTHVIAFPLQDAGEAKLMKYYLEYMCTWVSIHRLI